KDRELSNALPADAALGNVDYYELVGFSDHRSTADIWYRLLNLGFRLPAGAGTDAMANYASLRGPVGMNRVFIAITGETTPEKLHAGLEQGRTFVTNGPLLGVDLDGKHPGETFHRPNRRNQPNTQFLLPFGQMITSDWISNVLSMQSH